MRGSNGLRPLVQLRQTLGPMTEQIVFGIRGHFVLGIRRHFENRIIVPVAHRLQVRIGFRHQASMD